MYLDAALEYQRQSITQYAYSVVDKLSVQSVREHAIKP